jgi:hypothetical protein
MQSGDDILTSLERNARDLGVKAHRIRDCRVAIVQILVAAGKDLLDKFVRRNNRLRRL